MRVRALVLADLVQQPVRPRRRWSACRGPPTSSSSAASRAASRRSTGAIFACRRSQRESRTVRGRGPGCRARSSGPRGGGDGRPRPPPSGAGSRPACRPSAPRSARRPRRPRPRRATPSAGAARPHLTGVAHRGLPRCSSYRHTAVKLALLLLPCESRSEASKEGGRTRKRNAASRSQGRQKGGPHPHRKPDQPSAAAGTPPRREGSPKVQVAAWRREPAFGSSSPNTTGPSRTAFADGSFNGDQDRVVHRLRRWGSRSYDRGQATTEGKET